DVRLARRHRREARRIAPGRSRLCADEWRWLRRRRARPRQSASFCRRGDAALQRGARRPCRRITYDPGRNTMRIHNLYTDANGESHFRDVEVEWVEQRRGSKMSKRLPASGIIFGETQAEHAITWHPARRRQYIIHVDAGV